MDRLRRRAARQRGLRRRARCPTGFDPAAWAADVDADYPAGDRQQLLVFDGDGATAAIELGSHAFAWRLPGVIAGALTAALLYLLARILFRRRLVAGLVGLFVLVDGMFFVQSRIGMNDVYVGLFIVAAYTVFAARLDGLVARPSGVLGGHAASSASCSGLALASKWVAPMPSAALVLLILVRSALGRVLAILGLIALTGVLGYMAISVARGPAGFGNLTFLLIMIALTLLAVVVAVLHPIAWTDEEMRFAVIAPGGARRARLLRRPGARAARRPARRSARWRSRRCASAIALGLGSLVVVGLFWLGGPARASGRWRSPPGPGRPGPACSSRRRRRPRAGSGRAGCSACRSSGWPPAWSSCRSRSTSISYIPWAMVEDHQLVAGWPAGHTGQTLLDLTGQMYGYHNGLTAAHPASSPWWAWPLNLKPVWFYQEGLAGGHGGGALRRRQPRHLVAGRPGAWPSSAWMAFKRRSLALALIAIGFAAQWIPWARIDRAAFQYHYYTALPFVVLALAYFVAELWHGASRRDLALARVAGGRRDRAAGRDVAALAAAVRLRRRRVGQPGVAGLPGGHPGASC